MTKIKFFKNKDVYTGFECSGHTGYAEFGKDILCASISSMTQSVVLGVIKVLKISAKVTHNDDKGYIKLEMPENLKNDLISKSQILFETLKVGVEDLLEGYDKYIKMEVIENVY